MSTKTYHGSCHCKQITFEVDLDLSAGTGKCNCTYCWKVRWWGMVAKPAAFRLLSGEDSLRNYQFGTFAGHHQFCASCGIHPFGRGELEILGGAFVSINLACLDDLDPAELAEAPVQYQDGRNNAWQNKPTESRHL
jgi:hypothetical protein